MPKYNSAGIVIRVYVLLFFNIFIVNKDAIEAINKCVKNHNGIISIVDPVL
jgi:hypothetical protein